MLVRVQSPQGTKRIELTDKDKFESLINAVTKQFSLVENCKWFLSRSRNEKDKLMPKSTASVNSIGIKHGDLLYIVLEDKKITNNTTLTVDKPSFCESETSSRNSSSKINGVFEDEIDQQLAKMDGQVKRNRNEQLCHHPPSGQCIHCVPLEPFDMEYLSHCDPPVKFLSFHAYLRKLQGGKSKGQFFSLDEIVCRVKPGCREHPAWPEGICTKCQPSPVTLDRQAFRHIDYVQFENSGLVERFIDYWRKTGCQRVGVMLGHYEHYNSAAAPPLAIKAVVAAIYEPEQESTARSVKLTCPLDQLLPPEAEAVARQLDLRPVGWIFTDLVAEDPTKGTVKHYRGTVDTFFLSAQEAITAARLQNLHPNPCKWSRSGRFGSKFTTVVVTGSPDKQIHFEAYQVSNLGMALQRDACLVPTYDAPELAYIRETTREQFVPEVFYTSKDKYGNKVTQLARPLPMEYLLVDLPVAFPLRQMRTFASPNSNLPAFPSEHRQQIGQVQDFQSFASYLRSLGPDRVHLGLSNFSLLVWLARQDSLPLALPPHVLTSASQTTTMTSSKPAGGGSLASAGGGCLAVKSGASAANLVATGDEDAGLLGLVAAVKADARRDALGAVEAADDADNVDDGLGSVDRLHVRQWMANSSDWATLSEMALAIGGDVNSPPPPPPPPLPLTSSPSAASFLRPTYRDAASLSAGGGGGGGGGGGVGGLRSVNSATGMATHGGSSSALLGDDAGASSDVDMETAMPGPGAGTGSAGWSCSHCTFHNSAGAECDMCGLPRSP